MANDKWADTVTRGVHATKSPGLPQEGHPATRHSGDEFEDTMLGQISLSQRTNTVWLCDPTDMRSPCQSHRDRSRKGWPGRIAENLSRVSGQRTNRSSLYEPHKYSLSLQLFEHKKSNKPHPGRGECGKGLGCPHPQHRDGERPQKLGRTVRRRHPPHYLVSGGVGGRTRNPRGEPGNQRCTFVRPPSRLGLILQTVVETLLGFTRQLSGNTQAGKLPSRLRWTPPRSVPRRL